MPDSINSALREAEISAPGVLVDNLVYFARALRRAGIAVGPRRVVDAARALQHIEFQNRQDFYWCLHAVFVSRRADHPVFDEIFSRFWRGKNLVEKMLELLSPAAAPKASETPPPAGSLRAKQALEAPLPRDSAQSRTEIEIDAALTYSAKEKLASKDFAQMTAEEIAVAQRAVKSLVLPIDKIAQRRLTPGKSGRIDPRRSMRASLRSGGDIIELRLRKPLMRHPPLIILCDISGSMAQYSRLFLHFAHAMAHERQRVHSFVFGTRLSNVTQCLAAGDPDKAIAACAAHVRDWSGGTRIASCIRRFNHDWSRRVLGGGAVVLMVSDGLERELNLDLEAEMDRLHRSCQRLIWLNPLLRYDGFQARAQGIRAIVPHVDELRPVHNLASITELCAALSSRPHAQMNTQLRTPRDYL